MISLKTIITILFIVLAIATKAQNGVEYGITIKGTVTDSMKEPIPYASVIVKRNDVFICGTATDFDGNYSINVKDTGYVNLSVYHTGYVGKTIQRAIPNQEKYILIDVSLKLSGKSNVTYCPILYQKPMLNRYQIVDHTYTTDEIKHLPY